jgi:ABC-type branched-subunit amino acid transport system permease subunit
MTEEHQTEEHHDYLEEERVPEHSGTNHSMAIGFYIAALILIYGVTMVLVGLISPAAPSEGDLGFNVNFWWGLVMVVAGCVVLGMTLASPRRRAAQRRARGE